jgi:hypothetical protein
MIAVPDANVFARLYLKLMIINEMLIVSFQEQ